ncbi:MAG: molybdopterin-dependent oxidoreductase [Armatimonadetes bacterium]|nr:molybdopterin-dependent oxidoreductase [Armatimonadota bacterium]
MSEISLTINGKQVKGERGDTILKVCERSDIYVPTLCHYGGVHEVGTCRMCVVEVQGGRALTTACTTPAEDGMIVKTESDAIQSLRRATLELLFSERNHYCMFCEASGDCELQALAYRHGMDSVRYPNLYPKMELDTSHPYLALDQNRCVLCRRCVRVCAELVGAHSLGMRERGIETLLAADGGEPLSASSCVSCGACVQVCPTGALFDRRSAYRGREKDCTTVKSSCPECALGCAVELVARSGQVLRVEGDVESPENGGLLCRRGRYESLNGHRERVLQPLVRKGGELASASWDEALAALRAGIEAAAAAGGAGAVAAVASARASNEALAALRGYFQQKLDSPNVGAIGAAASPDGYPAATLQDIRQADLIILAGEDAGANHQVVEFAVSQAVEQHGAALIVVGSAARRLQKQACVVVPAGSDEVARALATLTAAGSESLKRIACAERAVFVVGAPVTAVPQALAAAAQSARDGWPRVLALAPKGNSRGAAQAGLNGGASVAKGVKAAFIMAGDDTEMLDRFLPQRDEIGFLAVQASYRSPLVEMADVVLPAPVWTEKAGTMVNAQGREVSLRPAVAPPAGVRDEADVLAALSQ